MSDPSMTTVTLLIRCPVCAASGRMIHHDIRSSLVYSCLNCTHEWQIDPAVRAGATPTVTERRRTSSQAKEPPPHKA
jgi:DNA-directed RNA polymerase subunit RPC12/RpoP